MSPDIILESLIGIRRVAVPVRLGTALWPATSYYRTPSTLRQSHSLLWQASPSKPGAQMHDPSVLLQLWEDRRKRTNISSAKKPVTRPKKFIIDVLVTLIVGHAGIGYNGRLPQLAFRSRSTPPGRDHRLQPIRPPPMFLDEPPMTCPLGKHLGIKVIN